MFVSYLFIGQLTPFPSGLCPQADYFTSHFVFSIPLHTSLPPTSHHLKVTIDGSLPDNSLFLVQCCLTFQIHHVYLFPLLALVFFYHNHVHHLHFFISHPFTPLLRQPTVSFCWDQPSLLLIKDSGFSHDQHTKPVHFVPQSRLFTLWSTATSEPVSGNQLFLLLRISWILISTASIESIFFEELALKRRKNEYWSQGRGIYDSFSLWRSSKMTRVEEYQKQVCPVLANCRLMLRFSSGKLYLFV